MVNRKDKIDTIAALVLELDEAYVELTRVKRLMGEVYTSNYTYRQELHKLRLALLASGKGNG